MEVHGLEPLTDGRVFLRNDALYQLVRTNMDNPEDANPQETHIDEAVYQQYQRNIQGYLEDADQQFSYPDVAYQRKLTDVSLYAESDFLQVKIYCIGTVVTTEPPEAAASLIAGGGFVDSALQLHEDGNGSDNFMVCADGHCVGFVGWEFAEQLDAFQTQEELVAAVESQGRMFPPEA